MRRLFQMISAAMLAVGLNVGIVVAQDENYPGESDCAYFTAWPGGSHLSQMHPYHVRSYEGYAASKGWNACVAWARDQMNSAINGLRAVGYSLTTPEVRNGPFGAASCEVFDDRDWSESGSSGQWNVILTCGIDGADTFVVGVSFEQENTATGWYTYWWGTHDADNWFSLGKTFTRWSN